MEVVPCIALVSKGRRGKQYPYQQPSRSQRPSSLQDAALADTAFFVLMLPYIASSVPAWRKFALHFVGKLLLPHSWERGVTGTLLPFMGVVNGRFIWSHNPRDTLTRDTWYAFVVGHFWMNLNWSGGMGSRCDSKVALWALKPHLWSLSCRSTTNAAWVSYIFCKAYTKTISESGR